MIKHVVMWKLKENAQGATRLENALKIKDMLEALPPKINQIKELQVGIHCNPDAKGAYDACLITVFDSYEDLSSYQNDPHHKAVSAFVAQVRESRIVVDFEM